jgi:teichuronic acid biosynthesis glycosyltransferase TuaC
MSGVTGKTVAVSDTKTSVFFVVGGDWKDGELTPPPFVRSQAESLRGCDCEVFLAIVDDRTSVRGILRNIRRICAEARRAQPKLIHAQYGSVIAGMGRLVRGSAPLIVSFCGDDLLGTPAPGVIWRIREACSRAIGLWAARGASTIIVKSKSLFETLPSDLQRKAVVVPNGVDADAFRPMDQNKCRAALGWSKKAKIILFDGSWNGLKEDNRRKNPMLARETVELLASSIPDISLHAISNVPHRQIPLMMNAADCLLVTSLQEGSPNIVKEAMACNLPIVSVPCGDVAERLGGTSPGGIRPYNAASLAACVKEVILAGRRSNGRERLIEQGLTTSKVAEQVTQIYMRAKERYSTGVPSNESPKRCAA